MAQVGRAELCLLRGEPLVAAAGARHGAECYASIPDAVGESDALRLQGQALLVLGQLPAAEQALQRALGLAREHGSALIEAEVLKSQAELHHKCGRMPEARRDARLALVTYQRLGATPAEAELSRWLDTLQ